MIFLHEDDVVVEREPVGVGAVGGGERDVQPRQPLRESLPRRLPKEEKHMSAG